MTIDLLTRRTLTAGLLFGLVTGAAACSSNPSTSAASTSLPTSTGTHHTGSSKTASPVPVESPVAPESTQALQAALKELQELKAANAETLRKQAATLEQLDELEKTADQIRIYARRG